MDKREVAAVLDTAFQKDLFTDQTKPASEVSIAVTVFKEPGAMGEELCEYKVQLTADELAAVRAKAYFE